MKTIVELLTGIVSDAFASCGFDPSLGEVGVSDRPELCQFQCNGAFAQAKRDRRPPMDIAGEVAEILSRDSRFSRVEAVRPGFLNLTLDDGWLLTLAAAVEEDPHLGVPQIAEPETIVLDYGGPNVAKPLHIGHLRSAIIGESMKRIYKFFGNHTIGDVHLGDWGLQMGLIIAGLQDRQPELCYFDGSFTGPYPEEAPFTMTELETIYPAASARSKEDPAFAQRAHEATFALQEGRPGYRALWKHIMAVSLADIRKNYDNLDVHFESWLGESDAQPDIPPMLEQMQAKGLAVESDGALIFPVAEDGDKKEMPPCILVKSDGATLYDTTDLATLVQRERDFHPD